jgi:predicted regulator of Ras-like GTPase activity (Roadblock/LC7/MglB family)
MPNDTTDQMMIDMENVRIALVRANKYHLTVEVVYFALAAVQTQPDLSIQDALSYALREWDC